MRETRPNVVINAAAYTAVDKAESEPDKAMQINGVAPGILAEEAKKLGRAAGALLDGLRFRRRQDRRPTSRRMRRIRWAPMAARSWPATRRCGPSGGAHLIFRLCWVYGARGQNFMLTMMRLAREREKLRVVGDQVGCPTWSRMIAETTALALKQAVAARGSGAFTGTYHLAAAGVTSWHGFAEAIVKLMPADGKKCRRVEAITTAEYPTPAKRPAYSVLCVRQAASAPLACGCRTGRTA